MKNQNDSGGGHVSRDEVTSPHVSREVKHQLGALGIDSLYLVVEYPHDDVFKFWVRGVGDLHDPRLHEGLPYEGYVLKRGGNGYKLSVWAGDARIFITDRVDDKLHDTSLAGQGMGVMLQLGPKWLRQFGEAWEEKRLISNILGQLMLFGIEDPAKYPMRINRLDIALDVLGLDLGAFSVDEWLQSWVGYAKPRNFHFDARSGQLTGFHVGSYKGNVSLKVYDKVTESEKKGTSRFWRSVWNVSEDEDDLAVTRFEWSIRCYKARFAAMRYLTDFTFEGFLGVLNYVSQQWGSLRLPGADPNHKSRWALHPLWLDLRAFIDAYSDYYEDLKRPQYVFKPDLKPAYLNALCKRGSGWNKRQAARSAWRKRCPTCTVKGTRWMTSCARRLRSGRSTQNWRVGVLMMTRRVEVVPPSPEVIDHFVHRVYWELELNNPDHEREFASFLKVVARVVAKALSRKASGAFDRGIERV